MSLLLLSHWKALSKAYHCSPRRFLSFSWRSYSWKIPSLGGGIAKMSSCSSGRSWISISIEEGKHSSRVDPESLRRHLHQVIVMEQRRFFQGYNVVNPVLDYAKKTRAFTGGTLDFSLITPQQLLIASKQLYAEYDVHIAATLKRLNDVDDYNEKLNILLDCIEGDASPLVFCHNIAALMSAMHLDERYWMEVEQRISSPLEFLYSHPNANKRQELLDHYYQNRIRSGAVLSALQSCTTETVAVEQFTIKESAALKRVNQHIRSLSNCGVHPLIDREAWNALTHAWHHLIAVLGKNDQGLKSNLGSKNDQIIGTLQSLLAIKQKQANMLGYDSHVERAFHSRNTSLLSSGTSSVRTTMEHFHEEIRQRIVLSNNADSELSLSQPTAWFSSFMARLEPNLMPAVGLSNFVSLKGTLRGLFALCKSLFGVIIVEQVEDSLVWHSDVRLFHIFNELSNERLGSFYFDPFRRKDKKRGFFTCRITEDIVYVSGDIESPTWEYIKAPVEMKDIERIFHEFGHVLRFLLADTDKRHGLEKNDAALEMEEVVPRFMEYLARQETVLEHLASLSSDTKVVYQKDKLPRDLIQQSLLDSREAKMKDCLEYAFLSQVEFDIFSDRNGSNESLLDLQRRLAQQFVPHSTTATSSTAFEECDQVVLLSPMIQVVVANHRHPVAQYRFLLAEIVSADIFQAFQNSDVETEEGQRNFGSRIEKVLLKPGVMVDGKAALQELCGRPTPSTDGFFQFFQA